MMIPIDYKITNLSLYLYNFHFYFIGPSSSSDYKIET